MELIKHEAEAKFHSVTDMNHKQEGEILDLDEQVDSNSSSNSLMVSKVTQVYNGAPLPTFIYTNETVRAICVKGFLPEPIYVSFLNEYVCVLEFPTEFELHRIAVDVQLIMQWFGYDAVRCVVVTKDKLNEIAQGREAVWMLQGEISKLPLSLPNKFNNR